MFRGIPRNEDEIAKAILKPGELSAGAAASLASAGPGRGRGLSGDRGRGVSGDREPPQVAGGRAFHRGSITSPAPSVSSVTSPVSDLSSNISSSLHITRTSGVSYYFLISTLVTFLPNFSTRMDPVFLAQVEPDPWSQASDEEPPEVVDPQSSSEEPEQRLSTPRRDLEVKTSW